MAHAIDRQLIVDALLEGFPQVSNRLFTPAYFGYIEGLEWYPCDVEKAKSVLAEAGNTERMQIEINTAPRFEQRIVQAIQQQLADVGVTLTISMSDIRGFLKRRRADSDGFDDTVFGRWSCARQDADGVLFTMFHADSLHFIIRVAVKIAQLTRAGVIACGGLSAADSGLFAIILEERSWEI